MSSAARHRLRRRHRRPSRAYGVQPARSARSARSARPVRAAAVALAAFVGCAPVAVAVPATPAAAAGAASALDVSLLNVPGTLAAGGPPGYVEVVLANPTPSDHHHLTNVLFTGPHATVQVRRESGEWRTLPKVPAGNGRVAVYPKGEDSSVGAGRRAVARLRVWADRDAPEGTTALSPCVFVGGEAGSFDGPGTCGPRAVVRVVAGPGHAGGGGRGAGPRTVARHGLGAAPVAAALALGVLAALGAAVAPAVARRRRRR